MSEARGPTSDPGPGTSLTGGSPGSISPSGPAGETVDDPVEREAIAADARLLRRVRWRLAAWSGGTTLAALFVLGLALYLAVARSLAASGTDQLEERATALRAFIQR